MAHRGVRLKNLLEDGAHRSDFLRREFTAAQSHLGGGHVAPRGHDLVYAWRPFRRASTFALAVSGALAVLARRVGERTVKSRTSHRANRPGLSFFVCHREDFTLWACGSSGSFGNRAGSGRSPFRVFTSQVVSPMCPNFPHRGHILPTFRTGLGRKKPARLPRNSVIIICIGGRVDQGPLGYLEGLAVRCANRVASTRYIPSLAFESIPRRHSRIPAHPARLSKKTEPNEGPEPTSLLVRPLS